MVPEGFPSANALHICWHPFISCHKVGRLSCMHSKKKGLCKGFFGSKRGPPTSSLCWSGRLFVSLHIRFHSVQSVAIFPISQINESMSIPFYSIIFYSMSFPILAFLPVALGGRVTSMAAAVRKVSSQSKDRKYWLKVCFVCPLKGDGDNGGR